MAENGESEEEGVRLPTSYVGLDETPISFANNFLIQHQEDEFLLTVAALAPPPTLGSEEQVREQLSQIEFVPIQVLGRYGLTRRRLVELIELLKGNLEKHDERFGEGATE
jgi:hypothetical protein